MCNECGRSICVSVCPNYSGQKSFGRGRSWGRCPICDAIIDNEEAVKLHGGRAVCNSCGELIDELEAIRYKILYNARREMLKGRRVNDRKEKGSHDKKD